MLDSWRRPQLKCASDFLQSAERLQALLERERMRCDRGNASFSLLTLTFSARLSDSNLTAIARTLRDRLRITDDAGIWSARAIGVILPETPVAGAWKLADDLCELMPHELPRPKCEVFAYPSDEQPEEVLVGEEAEQPEEDRISRPMHTLFVRPMPAWKRAIDVIGASVALVLAAPLLLAVAVAIKLTSPGPVIFKQRRHTIGGRKFMMYKFRTMAANAEQRKTALLRFSEQDGPAFKLAKDPRVTALGRFLRKTSIDELPQLVNVLLGDMSVVGPRPLPCDESDRCEQWQLRRLDVTSGLTCIWQVRGRSAVSFCDWIRMDIEYIRSRSLINDVKLIAQTMPAVLLRRGAC
jgi:lipopolysaccharide/colanic/teichoic acid biosynthesis glycosyltransferase